MKKGTYIAAAVFNFLFAAVILALAAIYVKTFIRISASIFNSPYFLAIFIIFFIIMIIVLVIICLPLIMAVVNLVIATLNIAAGVIIIKEAKNAEPNQIRMFSLICLIINTFYASVIGIIFLHLGKELIVGVNPPSFGIYDILNILTFFFSLISIILNAVVTTTQSK